MPYTTDEIDEKKMQELTYDSVCAECFSSLAVCWGGAFGYNSMLLRCSRDPKHHGIARIAEKIEYNSETRREFMEQDKGKETALALRRFDAVVTLDRKSATDILEIMWPHAREASPAEFARALGLCVDYGLDPRLNELFLIPFNVRQEDGTYKTEYQTVRGIKATRKVALRKHKYSYIDFTPRLMTEEEEKKVYRTPDPDKIRYITRLKDMETGAEAAGYGEWAVYKVVNGKKVLNNPKGIDKGNSMENMAAIRSERAALERLYPADMPSSRIPVIDESFIDADYKVQELFDTVNDENETIIDESDTKAGENETKSRNNETEPGGGEPGIIRPAVDEKVGEQAQRPATDVKADPATHQHPGGGEQAAQTTFSSTKGVGKPKISPAPPADHPELKGFIKNQDWLRETRAALKMEDDRTMLSFLAAEPYKVTGKTVIEALEKLTWEQAEIFTKTLNDKVARAQPELF